MFPRSRRTMDGLAATGFEVGVERIALWYNNGRLGGIICALEGSDMKHLSVLQLRHHARVNRKVEAEKREQAGKVKYWHGTLAQAEAAAARAARYEGEIVRRAMG